MTAPNFHVAPTPSASAEQTPNDGRRRHRISAHEYELLAKAGAFDDQRVELIDGEIIYMIPSGEGHAMSVSRTTKRLNVALDESLLTRPQNPINAGTFGRPEPDVAVVLTKNLVQGQPPSEIELAIEVSDSTLKYDQTDKASLYASLGVPDYWIVNLVTNVLEVRRAPIELPAARFGFDYSSIQIIPRTGSVSPLVAPDVVLRVEDLLP